MLIGVFELLADAREQVGERQRAIDATARLLARRDRRSQLALTGKSPGGAIARSARRAPPTGAAGGH